MGYRKFTAKARRAQRKFDLRGLGVFAVKKIFLLSIFLLASCAPAAGPVPTEALPTVASTPLVVATQTSTPTVLPPPPTATQVSCDPFAVDFCITDGHFLFQNPILPPGDTSIDISYRYGSTQNGTRDPHHGVEIGKGFGTPIHAAGEGVVQFAGPDEEAVYSPWRDFYGNVVVIRHADEMYTLYAHLSKVDVWVGDEVEAGDLIGEMGQSGAATGSHLHFEVRRGDAGDYFSTQNPELWLLPNQTDFGAVALSIVNGGGAFQRSSITVQRVDETDDVVASHYVDTYHPSLASGLENASLGGLPTGRYRIALIFNGQVYERWVGVQSGKLTQVVFVVE